MFQSKSLCIVANLTCVTISEMESIIHFRDIEFPVIIQLIQLDVMLNHVKSSPEFVRPYVFPSICDCEITLVRSKAKLRSHYDVAQPTAPNQVSVIDMLNLR